MSKKEKDEALIRLIGCGFALVAMAGVLAAWMVGMDARLALVTLMSMTGSVVTLTHRES